MPLSKELSVPDSTMQSSQSSQSSPTAVKRAAVTYGRRRDHLPILDADSSSSSRHSLMPTGPPNTSEEIPPTSDAELDAGPSSPDASSSGPNFTFSWKNKLKEIDEADDNDFPAIKDIDGGFGDASLFLGTRSKSPTPTSSLSNTTSPSNGVPNAPDPIPTSSQSVYVDNSPISKRRAKRPLLAVVSDSESFSPAKPFGSSPTSPASPHPITTPMTHTRTSTPPTSDADEDGEVMPSGKSLIKGKGKAVNTDVPPLRLFKETEKKTNSAKEKGKGKQGRRPKVKAPTKKEKRETEFDRARLAADQVVYIERTGQKKYTREALFAKLKAKTETATLSSSDPIQQFTSSPADISMFRATSQSIPASPPPRTVQPHPPTFVVPILASDDEDELPTVNDLLEENNAKELAYKLTERKKQFLAQQPPRGMDDSDDDLEIVDNNMHIVADEEAEQRKAMKMNHVKVSEGRKRQMELGRAVGKGTRKVGALSLVPNRAVFGDSGKGRVRERWTQESLNRVMLEKVEMEKEEEIRKRETEWMAKGGEFMQKTEDGGNSNGIEEAYNVYAEKAASGRGMHMNEGGKCGNEDEDESDEEWIPGEMRGSAGPEPENLSGSTSPEQQYMSGTETLDDEPDEDQNQDSDEEVDDKETCRLRVGRRTRVLVDSDDENIDAENVYPHPLGFTEPSGKVLVSGTSFFGDISEISPLRPRGSISSLGTSDETENENDKENDTRRMWDKSEDKENKAVVRHTLFGSGPTLGRGTLLGLEEGLSRALSMSPGPTSDDDDENTAEKSRTPFKELRKGGEDCDPFLSPQTIKSTFTQRLASTSQLPSPGLAQVLDTGGATFSQLYDNEKDENGVLKPKALESGFSQFFESGTEDADLSLKEGFGSPFSENRLAKLRPPIDLHSFPLTLDVGLAPPLEVNENRKRQADSIFEKEQAYLVEGYNRKPLAKEVLYINDHGFLTQTRPDGPNPEVYRISPPQTQDTEMSNVFGNQRTTQGLGPAGTQPQETQRRPLGTLSLSTDDLEQSPLCKPLRRLKKREMSPRAADDLGDGYRPSSSPRLPNAFKILRQNAETKSFKEKRLLEKSEFIEREAEESDDDEMHGFGGFGKRKEDGEEADGEDLDATLEELVDDKEMNEEEIAEKAVREKHQEQLHEDDKAAEKIAQDAVDGKFRIKRRNRGINLEDSDEDEGEDEARRIRYKMSKKRRIEGDNLEALGQNTETRPFYDAYQQELQDENIEFAHLQGEYDAMDYDDIAEEEEVVLESEIRQKAHQIAHMEGDYHSVSWVEQQETDENDSIHITEVSLKVRKSSRRQSTGDFDTEYRERTAKDEVEEARLAAWAKTESRSMNRGTGRSAVGAAVTGHRKPNVKAGGGSLRTVPLASGSGAKQERRHVVTAPSMLAKVSDRSGLFG